MERYAGILLPVTALPSEYGIGCFSKTAYDFVDWLARAGQRYWQILPLGAASHIGAFDSPYQAYSAFAGNPNLISLEDLIAEGVLTRQECDAVDFGSDPEQVDYDRIWENRLPLLHRAYSRSDISHNPAYQKFIYENSWWLEDYALFMAVKEFFGGICWTDWPEDIRLHWQNALDYYREKLYFEVEFQKYLQFQFHTQWHKLKQYANDRGIEIVGDIPIYVSMDGADVWAHPELFQLDGQNRQTRVAGCPPDGFAPDGQVWGNPLYNWDYHRKTGYHWWITRMWHSFTLYDMVRIDHFRGFDQYFSIPFGEKTAWNGQWEQGPGMELFDAIRANLGERKIIAEDLGFLTESVRQLVRDSGFPNMKVLQFAFDPGDVWGGNDYLPHHYDKNCVVYTGTHDNETIAGWFKGQSREGKDYIRSYLDDHRTPVREMHWKMIALAMSSVADTCIIPMQDYLGLDNRARLNVPGVAGGNWSWRLRAEALTEALAERIFAMTKRYGRADPEAPEPQKAPREADTASAEEIQEEQE